MSEMFVNSCSELTEEQSVIFGNLLIEFCNIFAKDDTDLGCFVGVSINLGGRMYRWDLYVAPIESDIKDLFITFVL